MNKNINHSRTEAEEKLIASQLASIENAENLPQAVNGTIDKNREKILQTIKTVENSEEYQKLVHSKEMADFIKKIGGEEKFKLMVINFVTHSYKELSANVKKINMAKNRDFASITHVDVALLQQIALHAIEKQSKELAIMGPLLVLDSCIRLLLYDMFNINLTQKGKESLRNYFQLKRKGQANAGAVYIETTDSRIVIFKNRQLIIKSEFSLEEIEQQINFENLNKEYINAELSFTSSEECDISQIPTVKEGQKIGELSNAYVPDIFNKRHKIYGSKLISEKEFLMNTENDSYEISTLKNGFVVYQDGKLSIVDNRNIKIDEVLPLDILATDQNIDFDLEVVDKQASISTEGKVIAGASHGTIRAKKGVEIKRSASGNIQSENSVNIHGLTREAHIIAPRISFGRDSQIIGSSDPENKALYEATDFVLKGNVKAGQVIYNYNKEALSEFGLKLKNALKQQEQQKSDLEFYEKFDIQQLINMARKNNLDTWKKIPICRSLNKLLNKVHEKFDPEADIKNMTDIIMEHLSDLKDLNAEKNHILENHSLASDKQKIKKFYEDLNNIFIRMLKLAKGDIAELKKVKSNIKNLSAKLDEVQTPSYHIDLTIAPDARVTFTAGEEIIYDFHNTEEVSIKLRMSSGYIHKPSKEQVSRFSKRFFSKNEAPKQIRKS